MSKYFVTLVEGLQELPAITWAILAAGVLLAAGLMLLSRHAQRGRPALILSAVGLLVIAVLVAAGIPQILPESPEDGGLTTAGRFLYSPWFWAVVFCVISIAAIVLLLRNQKMTAGMLSTGALCVAVSFVLSCITLYRLPNGGSITPASMLPILLFAYLYGAVPGLAAGLIHGMLQLVQGAYVIHPFQFLLDYIFPFALLGLCGLFRKNYTQFLVGIVVASFVRFVVHFLSGYLFFYMYAAQGQSPFVYSLLYNGSYMLPETIICLLLAIVPQFRRLVQQLKLRAIA
ncbi:MAG: energy-coupled thiamine transporter ThiT [Eubacteriales bacterium]|nr:energy-coupled thiamine transporter ThiT [Eubacteriales bacterium]